jgi:hypothetical protein
MKYQNTMKTKLMRITNLVKYEIRSGKCTQADIDYILAHLKYSLSPWDAKDEQYDLKVQTEVDKES